MIKEGYADVNIADKFVFKIMMKNNEKAKQILDVIIYTLIKEGYADVNIADKFGTDNLVSRLICNREHIICIICFLFIIHFLIKNLSQYFLILKTLLIF